MAKKVSAVVKFQIPAGAATPAPPVGTGIRPGSSTSSMLGAGGGTNWMLWGGAIAAIAVGGALILRKKRR